ncbi:MAG: hypothetical protein MUE52_18985 [Tabrizicola sp.]|nr:hypothetical protein [Tabrizicola sp.]
MTAKGLFWLLEARRQNPAAQRFVLVGGDAAVGHFFYNESVPVTEATPHRAYSGCYALSKVLEEAMPKRRPLMASTLTAILLAGVAHTEDLEAVKPDGGTVCLQLRNVAAANIKIRAAKARDTLPGKAGIDRLEDQGGGAEIAGCPVFTKSQADQQMADTFATKPDLTAFTLIGGWLGPDAG